jgi:hypothetical protein
MDDTASSFSEVPMPQLLQLKPIQPEAVSRGAIASMSALPYRSLFHRQGSQSLSSSESAQESDNQSKLPVIEQKFQPQPAPNPIPSGFPTVTDDNRFLTTPPDIVEQALEESAVPRGLILQRAIPGSLPPLLIDLEEVIGHLEEESPSATEDLNPPPDPPWGNHEESPPVNGSKENSCKQLPHDTVHLFEAASHRNLSENHVSPVGFLSAEQKVAGFNLRHYMKRLKVGTFPTIRAPSDPEALWLTVEIDLPQVKSNI